MRTLLLFTSLLTGLSLLAHDKLDSLKSKFIQTNDLHEKGIILSSMGTVCHRLGIYDEAAFYYTEGIKIFEKVGDSTRIYKVHGSLGTTYAAAGEHRRGLEYMFKSMRLMEGKGDTTSYAIGLNGIGTIYQRMDMPDSAIFYYNRAEEVKLMMGDSIGLGISKSNIGNYYGHLGEYDNAVDQFLTGIAYIEPIVNNKERLSENDASLVEIVHQYLLANLGELYVSMEETEKSIPYLRKVIDFDYEYPSLVPQKLANKALAEAYELEGDYDKSLEYYQKFIVLKDSLFNEEKINSINEISAKYETEKKEAENAALKIQNKLANENIELQNQKLSLGYILLTIIAGLSIVLLVIIVSLVSRNRLIRELNAEMKLKNQVLSEAKQKIELKALLNQINPHFIFNVLNSIQQFVLKNDSQSSLNYFHKFGTLIRSSLEHSEKKFVPLQEEIDVIENYVALENLRFENAIKLNIDSGDIDSYNVKVPPMFIQPLVENAIVHGLSGKDDDRSIDISFEESEDAILCKVKDNGLGRDEERVKLRSEHNSGLTITRKRLRSIWMKSDNDVMFEDLKDPNLGALGTIAKIKLPKSF